MISMKCPIESSLCQVTILCEVDDLRNLFRR
jgi:hypothetical protein